MARKFFYVCAGLLCLALAYHLGARSATGQTTAVIEGVSVSNDGLSAAVNGSYIKFDANTGAVYVSYPLPVTGHVLEASWSTVVYENGDVYVYQGSPGAWVLKGNLARGPTPAKAETWGSVKARYR